MSAVIVTGSDSGIGKATAVHLARAGYDIGITWHEDEDGARDAAQKVEAEGRRAEVRRLDLAELPAAADVIDELAEALGGVDVFVNNAGTSRNGPFLDLSWDDWMHTLDVDLNAAFLCAQRAARRDGGAGPRRSDRQRHVGARARSAARDRRLRGREARSRRPDEADGARARRARDHGQRGRARRDRHADDGKRGRRPRALERPAIPAGRPGDANEVAALIAHLCTREAAYITGASYVIDGGLLLMAAVRNSD